jgi:hypothetical protein
MEHGDVVASFTQAPDDVRTNEPSSSNDENPHGRGFRSMISGNQSSGRQKYDLHVSKTLQFDAEVLRKRRKR